MNSDQKLSIDTLKQTDQLFRELGGAVLGILPDNLHSTAADARIESTLMNLVVSIRAEVRNQKLWALSDVIRDGVKAIGFIIEDTKDGTRWHKIN